MFHKHSFTSYFINKRFGVFHVLPGVAQPHRRPHLRLVPHLLQLPLLAVVRQQVPPSLEILPELHLHLAVKIIRKLKKKNKPSRTDKYNTNVTTN